MPSFHSRSVEKAKECFIPYSKYSLIIEKKKVLYIEEVLYYQFTEFNMPYCIAIKIIQKMQLRLYPFQKFCLIIIVSYIEIYICYFYVSGADPRANVMASSSQLSHLLGEPIAAFVLFITFKIFHTMCSI